MVLDNSLCPNLIVPGVAKSGTSSLHLYLNQHPDLYMSEVKEPGYFFRDTLYQQQEEWYLSLFKGGAGLPYRGESSTYYFNYASAIERMKRDLPNPKFIILLRHPVERIISHYFWLWGKGLEYRSLRKAIASEVNEKYRPTRHIRLHHKDYLHFSLYSSWVKRYWETFGKEHVLVITNERLRDYPLETMNQCFSFLGVSKLPEIKQVVHNVSVLKKVPAWDRRMLHFLFQEDESCAWVRYRNVLIPLKLKQLYWKFHVKINENKTLDKKPSVSNEDYLWLVSLMKDDVKQLKDLLNDDLLEWKEFSYD